LGFSGLLIVACSILFFVGVFAFIQSYSLLTT
jgi:hypothetical protein